MELSILLYHLGSVNVNWALSKEQEAALFDQILVECVQKWISFADKAGWAKQLGEALVLLHWWGLLGKELYLRIFYAVERYLKTSQQGHEHFLSW